MEWLNKMMDAINYMEMNMEEKMDIENIAKIACSSPFHFQRMFHMLTGFTVAQYIRNRRLTLAAQELSMLSNVKVVDVALKYGYDSPESFSKTFKKAHGITPSAAREPGVNLKAFPRISFHLSLKGDKDMDYRIIEKKAFKVVGKIIKVSTKDEGHHMRISEFWDKCNTDGTSDKICSLDSSQNMLGISMEFEDVKEQFSYMIAIEDVNDLSKTDFDTREIPTANWAVFTSVGPMPHAIVNVISRIYQEWFPSTGFEQANAPTLEVYLPGNPSALDYKCEVWVPIVKK